MKKDVLILVAILLFGAVLFLGWNVARKGGEIACTMEAKLCPDGTAVGRTGPDCEFAPCPLPPAVPESWKTFRDATSGISFRYPEAFGTAYIDAYDWPPQARISDEPFACTEAGMPVLPAGKTEPRTIGGRQYCVTEEVGAAAGSTYTQYAYAFPRNGKTAILTFTVRAPQCGNYPDAQRTECEAERAEFDIDGLVDRIARTVMLP